MSPETNTATTIIKIIMQIITDFHTHILPEMDDGAKTLEESIGMLQQLKSQGVKRILLTPHFYPQKTSLEDFLAKREGALQALQQHPDFPRSIQIIPAAEVYLHETLMSYSTQELKQLCIPKTDYLLTELPYNVPLSPSVLQRVSKLIYDHNLVPVMAHIERYFKRLPHKKVMPLIEDGCRLQINLNCLERLNLFGKLRLFHYIKNDWIDCCGSDCHNLTNRPPNYQPRAARLAAIMGKEKVAEIITAASIF